MKPNERLFDKHQAAEYLKEKGQPLSISSLFHHIYKTRLLPMGRVIDGRRKWTETELKQFMSHERRRGLKPGTKDSVTVAQYFRDEKLQARAKAGEITLMLDDEKVIEVKRDSNDTREYFVKTATPSGYYVWNNTRLKIISNDSNSGSQS